MNITSLEITPEEATARLAEYEAQLHSERTREDEAIIAGYRAAKRGFPIISLPHVIGAGGWFENGLPKLAVVRADATQCWVEISYGNDTRRITYRDVERGRDRGALVGQHHVRVTAPAPDAPTPVRPRWSAKTIVPLIPPRHRPNPRRIRGFHILWEVERWDPTPPLDPALLRHIRGDLWSVMAVWDLTQLERHVLTQRRT